MGLESACRAIFNGQEGEGIAHLETSSLSFRGSFRLKIPFSEITGYEARGGILFLNTGLGPLELHLGSKPAERWYLKLRYPKTLIDKLGVKENQTVSVIDVVDEEFWKLLRQRTEQIADGEPRAESDFIFLQAESAAGLGRLAGLEEFIKREGAIWVVWPKGQKEIRQSDVMGASKRAGFVDVKVVSFSERLSALKIVIPVARR